MQSIAQDLLEASVYGGVGTNFRSVVSPWDPSTLRQSGGLVEGTYSLDVRSLPSLNCFAGIRITAVPVGVSIFYEYGIDRKSYKITSKFVSTSLAETDPISTSQRHSSLSTTDNILMMTHRVGLQKDFSKVFVKLGIGQQVNLIGERIRIKRSKQLLDGANEISARRYIRPHAVNEMVFAEVGVSFKLLSVALTIERTLSPFEHRSANDEILIANWFSDSRYNNGLAYKRTAVNSNLFGIRFTRSIVTF